RGLALWRAGRPQRHLAAAGRRQLHHPPRRNCDGALMIKASKILAAAALAGALTLGVAACGGSAPTPAAPATVANGDSPPCSGAGTVCNYNGATCVDGAVCNGVTSPTST